MEVHTDWRRLCVCWGAWLCCSAVGVVGELRFVGLVQGNSISREVAVLHLAWAGLTYAACWIATGRRRPVLGSRWDYLPLSLGALLLVVPGVIAIADPALPGYLLVVHPSPSGSYSFVSAFASGLWSPMLFALIVAEGTLCQGRVPADAPAT